MPDDATQSVPPPSEPAPTTPPEVAVPLPDPASPTPEAAPVAPQVPVAEPALAVPEVSPSAPESIVEPPEVEAPAPEPQPNPQGPSPALQQQAPAPQPPQSAPSTRWSAADRARAVAKRVGRKEARLAKIVALAKEKGGITNDDIEKLLHVSDATASRYGTLLVQRGMLKREGKGRSVTYRIP